MAFWDLPRHLWAYARKLDDLMSLQARTEKSVEAILERIHALETWMTHLEADRSQMITEAKVAAGMAASAIAGNILSDAITRITRLEMRALDVSGRLPPPSPVETSA
jgi:uncharacterized protein (UPF0335 family)